MVPVQIAYWNARALIQPIKMILEHVNVPYTVTIPKCGPAPFFSKDPWLKQKHELLPDYDFPNLPYFDDGERKLTHYWSIMEYLGLKHGMYPTKEQIIDASMIREQLRDIQLLGQVYMAFPNHRGAGTEPSIDEKRASRAAYISSVSVKIEELSQKYDKLNGKFTLGDNLTHIDFAAYEMLDHIRLLGLDCLSDRLSGFLNEVESLPSIKAFMSSDRYQKFPLYAERLFIGRSEGDWQDHA